MNNREILAIFDREMRVGVQIHEPGLRIDRAPGYVRIVGPSHAIHDNCVIYSDVADASVDAAIDEQIAYFGEHGRDFEWKLFDHDPPVTLAERLIAHGFEPDTPETVLVADLAELGHPVILGEGISARRIDRAEMLADVIRIQDMVWGEDHDWLVDVLSREMRTAARNIHILVAEHDGLPIACSWMRIHPGTRFASLWGAATLPKYRGRGAYRSLVDWHLKEARQMGVQYVCVDANGSSKPILERVGFRSLVGVRGYLWRGPTQPEAVVEDS